MPAEFWVYGGLMVAAGLLVWRIAMQYYTYLEDAYNHSEMTRNQLRAYLRGNDSVSGGPTDGGDTPPKSPVPAATAKPASTSK